MNCRNLLLSSVVALAPIVSFAQTSQETVSKKADLDVYSLNFDKVAPKIDQFINENSLVVKRKTQNYEKIYYDLVMTTSQYNDVKKNLEGWKCAIINSEETTQDLGSSISRLKSDIKSCKDDINALEKQIEATQNDSVIKYLGGKLERENERLNSRVNEYNKVCSEIGLVTLKLDIMRDETTPRQTKVRFVNMPGFEYDFLMIGNPKPGFSAKYYNGYNLKYLFTKGKTFVNLGVYKAMDVAKTDSTTLTDAFNVAFGQDFYSRHFGRGSRKCFNFYSGYNVGFMAFRGETSSTKTFYVTPTVGVELLKNRFLLWDLRGGYYLPFKHNYDLRGWQISSNINIAF